MVQLVVINGHVLAVLKDVDSAVAAVAAAALVEAKEAAHAFVEADHVVAVSFRH